MKTKIGGGSISVPDSRRPKGCCPLENLKVALIGGLDRLETRYRKAFSSLGAELYFHPGHCAGCGSNRLRSAANSADIVIFITTVNSHNALQVVKGLCKKSGKRFIVVRETGPERICSGIAGQLRDGIANAARR